MSAKHHSIAVVYLLKSAIRVPNSMPVLLALCRVCVYTHSTPFNKCYNILYNYSIFWIIFQSSSFSSGKVWPLNKQATSFTLTSPVAHEIKRNKLLYVENRNSKWSSRRRTDNVYGADCLPAIPFQYLTWRGLITSIKTRHQKVSQLCIWVSDGICKIVCTIVLPKTQAFSHLIK